MTVCQFGLFFVIGVVKSADVYEFSDDIRFKVYPSSDLEYGNEFQPQDYVLGSWGGNKLKFGGNLPDWSTELRAALRTNLLNNITADPRFADVQLITGGNPENFADVTSVQQCAELCVFVANLTDFGDLSCGGFQYSPTDSKCWPAQGWVIGKEYNDSCKHNLTHTNLKYCCIPETCCVTKDDNATTLLSCVKEYRPRRSSDLEDFAVYIRMFPPTQAPTISPTQPPTSSHRPTLFPTTSQPPTVSPSTSPTKTSTSTGGALTSPVIAAVLTAVFTVVLLIVLVMIRRHCLSRRILAPHIFPQDIFNPIPGFRSFEVNNLSYTSFPNYELTMGTESMVVSNET